MAGDRDAFAKGAVVGELALQADGRLVVNWLILANETQALPQFVLFPPAPATLSFQQ